MSSPDSDLAWQRSRELLAGKALGDLSQEEQAEVAELLKQEKFSNELFELERSATALELASANKDTEDLPAALRQRLQSDAQSFFDARQAELADKGSATAFAKNVRPGSNRREWLAWACCAAAILLSIGLLVPRPESQVSTALARAELLKSASDVVQVEWSSGTTPFEDPVRGDVVWSNEEQRGYMLFEGMPVNDPTVEQYQLWIIDPERDDEPIDGGVFDVRESGKVVVAIHAKLAVVSPKAFAITVEKPGGVVVSTQERLPLLAPVP